MASKRRRRKRCRFCDELFVPDPRLKNRQIACSKKECQKARKQAAQEDWLRRHPGYFEGRYENTKKWLEAHPGYLAEYRQKHPEKAACDAVQRKQRHRLAKEARADIQDAKSLQEPILKQLAPNLAPVARADIQDAIWPEIVLAAVFGARFAARHQRRYTRRDRPPDEPEVPSAVE